MISSNITSSVTKLPESSPAKSSEARVVVPKKSAPTETAPAVVAAPAVAATDAASSVAESRKTQEPPQSASEDVEAAMRDKVKEAVENVRDFIKKNQRSLDFEMAEESNRVIITVIDRETNEVIRQIPPEDVVNISEQINNGELPSSDGMLFKVKA